jgi:hypothetical protein
MQAGSAPAETVIAQRRFYNRSACSDSSVLQLARLINEEQRNASTHLRTIIGYNVCITICVHYHLTGASPLSEKK